MRTVEQPQLAMLVRRDVVGKRRAGNLPAGPSGRELPAEHPLVERLADHRAAVVEPGRRTHGAVHPPGGAGVIRSTMVVTTATESVEPGRQVSSTSWARSRTTRSASAPLPGSCRRARARADPRQPAAGPRSRRPGARERCARSPWGRREAPGYRPGSRGGRCPGLRRDRGRYPASVTVIVTAASSRILEVAQPRIIVGCHVDPRQAAQHFEPVAVASTCHERVQALLLGQLVNKGLAAAAGKGRDAPCAPSGACSVYQHWWARKKLPSPRWTIRTGAAGRPRPAVRESRGALTA